MNYSLHDFISLKKNLKKEIQIKIISGSLEPWIYKGEKITVLPCQSENINPLDIIVFWKNEKLICHVYVKNFKNYLITQALLGKTYDTPTHSKYLLGKVVSPRFSWYHKILFRYLK
jgi:hypothetical protein